MTKTVDMTQGNITSQLIHFAVPLLFGNIFQLLYNTVDCIIVGNYVGKDSLAAIGGTTHLISSAVGFFNGLSIGAGILISQYFGARNIRDLQKAIHTTVLGMTVLGVVLSFAGMGISPLVLRLIATPPSVFAAANAYLKIYFGGFLFLILYNMGAGILRAVGDSRHPVYFLIISSFVNIALDLLFILGFGWGIRGAAFATVIAEVVSTVLVFTLLIQSDEVYTVHLRALRIDGGMLLRILHIGLPGAISSSVISLSNTVMQKYVNVFGSACIAGFASFVKLDSIAFISMQSLAFSAATFVAQNYGAGNIRRVEQGIRKTLLLCLVAHGSLSVLMWLFAPQLIALFNREADVLHFGVLFLRLTVPLYILCCASMILSQSIRGMGHIFKPIIISFFGFVAFRQLFLFITTHLTDSFYPVALAYPFAWPITTCSCYLYCWHIIKKAYATSVDKT